MKAYLLFFAAVFLILITPALGSDWKDHGAVTLKWGETVNVSGYKITAIDFRPGTIEERKTWKNETTTINICEAEDDITQEIFKKDAASVRRIFGCDDWVYLTVFKNNVGVLEVALAERNITVEGMDFYNETTYHEGDEMLRIKAEDVVTGNNIPTPYATIRIFTKKNEEVQIDIAKNLSIKKTVSPEIHINPSWSWISVVLDVENIGNMNFSTIDVVDSPPQDFKLESMQELRWTIALSAGQKWQAIYSIKPLRPIAGKEYSLPKARLYVSNGSKQYNLSSNIARFVLFSSDIILNKTLEKKTVKPGENVTVLVHVKNNGSRASLVKIKDTLPQNAELVSGVLNFSTVLQPGTFYNNSYVIRINNASGNITIPPAELTFKEYKQGYDPENDIQPITGNATSLSPVITVGSTSPQLPPANSATVQKTENVEKREDTSSKQEESLVDGIIKKVRDLWSFIKSIV